MKVHIGPYKNWFGPYQLAEKLLFWMDKDKDDKVHDFGSWLAGENRDSVLLKVMRWIDSKRQRKIKVRIDPYDTWSMDNTLAYIILPMLKQLKASAHGAPDVDDSEVPDELKKINALKQTEEEIENHHADSNHFLRWYWVLNEMIFAFESQFNNWEEQFSSGEIDFYFEPCSADDDGTPTLYEMKRGPKDTYQVDWDGRNAYQARITNGYRLFGKFYESLWD